MGRFSPRRIRIDAGEAIAPGILGRCPRVSPAPRPDGVSDHPRPRSAARATTALAVLVLVAVAQSSAPGDRRVPSSALLLDGSGLSRSPLAQGFDPRSARRHSRPCGRGRSSGHPDRSFAEKPFADRTGDVSIGRIKTDQVSIPYVGGIARRPMRSTELCIINGAGRRRKRSLLRAIQTSRLARKQRSEVLVSHPARQHQQYQDAEAEGGCKATLRPVTRRSHPFADPKPQLSTHIRRRQKASLWRKCDRSCLLVDKLAIALSARAQSNWLARQGTAVRGAKLVAACPGCGAARSSCEAVHR